MKKEKQIEEMRKLAIEMEEAISTEHRKRILADEIALEEVLKANGWRKASEIFEEIERILDTLDKRHMLNGNPKQAWGVRSVQADLTELKKKYTESEGGK